MELIYQDKDIVVCVKPARVLSTDEPGGMPELVRQALGVADVRTVHRLDRVVSGLMVLALSAEAASELSRQIREDQFEKEYLAVVHGVPEQGEGRLCDLLVRDKARKMTMVAAEQGKGVQPASLRYRVLKRKNGPMSALRSANCLPKSSIKLYRKKQSRTLPLSQAENIQKRLLYLRMKLLQARFAIS